MPENTKTLDQKAEALRRIAQPGVATLDVWIALVYSNLAIAEGQERVAEEIKQLRLCLDEVIDPAAGTAFPAVLRVRTETAE